MASQPAAAVSEAPAKTARPPRLREMDGLRGLASLMVFVAHALQGLPKHTIALIGWVMDSGAAVDFFFVLSGFVLALPYVGARAARPLRYRDFAVRRVFRIYPAYLVALALALCLRRLYLPSLPHGFAEGMEETLSSSLSISEIVRTALLIVRDIPITKINGVIWSLIIEMRVSLVFPVFILLLRKLRPRGQTLAWAILAGIGLIVSPLGYPAMFLLGAVLAANLDALKTFCRGLRWPLQLVLWASALLLFHAGNLLPGTRILHDTVISAAMALLIVLVSSTQPARNLLSIAPLRFLGDVSYSFYLIHLPILLAAYSLLLPVDAWFIRFAALLASWIVSWLMFRYVELPMQSLGRSVSARIGRWNVVT